MSGPKGMTVYVLADTEVDDDGVRVIGVFTRLHEAKGKAQEVADAYRRTFAHIGVEQNVPLNWIADGVGWGCEDNFNAYRVWPETVR